MPTIEITYQERSRCEAVHAASGQRLRAEIGPPGTGEDRDRSLSPADLLAAAFGLSLAISLGQAAESEMLDLTGVKIAVTKEMTDGPRRRISRLRAVVEMPVPLTSGMKATFQRAAHNCPVEASLRAEIETAVQFVFL